MAWLDQTRCDECDKWADLDLMLLCSTCRMLLCPPCQDEHDPVCSGEVQYIVVDGEEED